MLIFRLIPSTNMYLGTRSVTIIKQPLSLSLCVTLLTTFLFGAKRLNFVWPFHYLERQTRHEGQVFVQILPQNFSRRAPNGLNWKALCSLTTSTSPSLHWTRQRGGRRRPRRRWQSRGRLMVVVEDVRGGACATPKSVHVLIFT